MVKKATAKGLLIYHDHKVKISPNTNGFMHDSRSGLAKLFRKKQRSLNENITKPKIHQSVLDRVPDKFNNKNENYKPWILKHPYDVEA